MVVNQVASMFEHHTPPTHDDETTVYRVLIVWNLRRLPVIFTPTPLLCRWNWI